MTKQILLADDSVTIQKVIELTFMDQDYEVVSVSHGDEAVTKVGEGVGDLVIADVHMPGANGYEVARRAKERDPNVPVLLLVGTFEPFEESEYEGSGADAYLKKPFDSQELLELVERLAAGAGTSAAGEADEDEMSFSDMELDLDDDEDDDLSLGEIEDQAPEPVFDLGGGDDLGSAEEETAGLGDGDAVWGNLDLDGEPPPAAEPVGLESEASESEEDSEESQPFRLSDEPGESFALETEAAPPSEADTVRMDALPEETRAQLTEPPEEPEEASSPPPPPASPAAEVSEASGASGAAANGSLSDEDVERIARRVVDLIGDSILRDVAWEVIPDLAEVVIKDRIRELERQVE